MRYPYVPIAALALATGFARAQALPNPDCTFPKTMEVLSACVELELRDTDARLNALYRFAMTRTDEAGRESLRAQQRDWIRDRDEACRVTTSEKDRDRWFEAVSTNYQTAACIILESGYRISDLQATIDGRPPTPHSELQGRESVVMQMATTTPDAQGRPRLPIAHDLGKWYFEVTVDREGSAKAGARAVMAGFRGVNDKVVRVTQRQLRTSDRGITVIGCAIDLDNGMLYFRDDGSWHDKEPGSNRGIAIKLGQLYSAHVFGKEFIGDLLAKGLIKPNYGEAPFVHALPDGYRSWR